MNKDQIIILKDRGLISVSGDDSIDFLQNIITNDITKVKSNNSIFSAILTPQGKYLYEFFILKSKHGFLLECDNEITSEIIEDTSLVLNLGDNQQYFWIVSAMDLDGHSTLSNGNDPHSFVVGTLSTDEDLIPTEFVLDQSYPNPFNPTTNIRFGIPSSAFVSINIYDVTGRLINKLLHQSVEAGYHNLQWDATNLYGEEVSTGLYFYVLETDDFIQTRKMLFMK